MQGKWRENLIKIKPYVAGEQSNDKDMIKLNANENPYPPSPQVKSSATAAASSDLPIFFGISMYAVLNCL